MTQRIDFYLYATHEVPTMQPIVEALRDLGADPRYVLEPPGRNLARGSSPDPIHGWRDDKQHNLTGLVDVRTHGTIEDQLRAAGEYWLTRRRIRATAVTTSGSRWLRTYAGARIRCMYGVGAVIDAYGHGPVNQGFDLILAHGPFSDREIARNVPGVNVTAVGFPKWAKYRRGEVSREDARSRLGLPPERAVVVWLPTWAHNSSLDAYRDALEALGTSALVVMKPHHNNERFESSRISGFDHIRVLRTTESLVDLIAAADVTVTDAQSRATTESILADRATVVIAPPRQEARIVPWAADAVELCEGPHDLQGAVDAAFADARSGRRAEVAERLFGVSVGDDGERAARAILQVASDRPASVSRLVAAAFWGSAYRLRRAAGC